MLIKASKSTLPFFKQHFCENPSKLVNFFDTLTLNPWTFFSFYPFFVLFRGSRVKACYFLDFHIFVKKKGKKGTVAILVIWQNFVTKNSPKWEIALYFFPLRFQKWHSLIWTDQRKNILIFTFLVHVLYPWFPILYFSYVQPIILKERLILK